MKQRSKTSVLSAFSNQGQICLCGSRILIQSSIYEPFKNRFLEKVRNLTVGDPQDPTSNLGALVSEDHMHKVLEHIRSAQEDGGTILHGGKQVKLSGELSGGWFVEPTVIEGLEPYV